MTKQQVNKMYYESIGLLPFITSKEVIINDDYVVDWDATSKSGRVSEELINKFSNKLNWHLLCECQKLSEEILSKYAYLIDYDTLSSYKYLSTEFIKNHVDTLNWELISRFNCRLTDDLVNRFADRIIWGYRTVMAVITEQTAEMHIDKIIASPNGEQMLYTITRVSPKFIEKYWDKLDHKIACMYGDITNEFIDTHADSVDVGVLLQRKKIYALWLIDHREHIDLVYLLRSTHLPDEFFINSPDWIMQTPAALYHMCVDQHLSESIIDLYAHVLNWGLILANQELSEEFILKHMCVDFSFDEQIDTILEAQKLSEEFLHIFRQRIDWSLVCQYQTHISESFILKHKKYIDWEALYNADRQFTPKIWKIMTRKLGY